MKASFVDLRKRSGEIIKALKRHERVTVLYRGKPAAIMQPIEDRGDHPGSNAKDHAAFGMWAKRADMEDVGEQVRRLRRGRFSAV